MKKIIALLCSLFVMSCVELPEGVKPVSNFKLNNYLGKWYEIARLDHRFEKGLNNVTAEYALREDGGVSVINRGYMAMHQEWRDAEGKAFFVGEPNIGHLKVSFFGPFYGSYGIIELDEDYQYALVCGDDTSYLWILSRTKMMDEYVLEELVDKAQALGFDTSKLIYVKHN